MRQFSFLEVAGEKDCVRCLALGFNSALLREVKLLRGSTASVRFECPACGFVLVGTVDVDASEASDLTDDSIMERIREARETAEPKPLRPQRNTPAVRRELSHIEPPRDYKTDEEALAAVYPDAIPMAELRTLVESYYPEQMEYRGQSVRRKIEPVEVRMGETGKLEGYTVSYKIGDIEVGTNDYYAADGVPQDLEQDVQKVAKSLASMVENATRAVTPRAAPKYPGKGVHISDNQSGNQVTIERQRGVPALAPGAYRI